MPDIKFSCPGCQQHIEADSGYAGVQIECPTCHTSFVVPHEPASSAPRLRLGLSAPPAQAPAEHTPAATPASTTAAGCPSCGNALARGAVLCVNCGYNLKTGQRMVAGQPMAPGRVNADPWETPWYKSIYPYVGLYVAVLGVLYLLGRQNKDMMMAFILGVMLYTAAVGIAVLVAAFREGVGVGFLTLCVPFYSLYFIFKVNENDSLKFLYGLGIILQLSLKFIVPGEV